MWSILPVPYSDATCTVVYTVSHAIGGFEFALDLMLNVRASDVNDRKSAGKRGSLMYHIYLWERLPRAHSEQPGR